MKAKLASPSNSNVHVRGKLLFNVAERWRQLLGFALLFRTLEILFFAPLAALVADFSI